MSFSKLGLSDALLRAVADAGYSTPTPIQAQAIPAVLAGGDLLAGAQTGTGKTAGFVLPMLQRLSTRAAPRPGAARKRVRALVVTPTRELAVQVETSVRVYGKHLNLSSTIVIGGVGLQPQARQLLRGMDIVVATPGRLLDHHAQGNVDLGQVEILVLDEADRMLDMGFIHDIKRLFRLLPAKRQNLLFSATFSSEVKDLADSLLDRPAMIEVAPRNATVDEIDQCVHPVARERKQELLAQLIGTQDWRQVLVFTRTKHGADKLTRQLNADGIGAVAIHGNKSQSARNRALGDFKDRRVRVLVATDIAARGIDIDRLPHVVNYDLPNVPEDYVHRIGRTGRAGAAGQAISLVSVDEHAFLRDIERLLRKPIRRQTIEGFEPDPSAVAQPIPSRRGPGPAAHARKGAGARPASGPQGARRDPARNAPRSPSRDDRRGRQAKGSSWAS